MLKYLLDSISKNNIYNISKFNTIKDDMFSLIKSTKELTSTNINKLLRKHDLTKKQK